MNRRISNYVENLLPVLPFLGSIAATVWQEALSRFAPEWLLDLATEHPSILLGLGISWSLNFWLGIKLLKAWRFLRPNLKLACGGNIPSCHIETEIRDIFGPADYHRGTTTATSYTQGKAFVTQMVRAKFFRVEVATNYAESIRGCIGSIDRIEKNGDKLNAEQIRLPFAPGTEEDAYSKTIMDGTPEHLDVLSITESNKIDLPINSRGYPASVKVSEIFNDVGEYIIHVTVSAENTIGRKMRLRFNWTGDWQTSTLEPEESF